MEVVYIDEREDVQKKTFTKWINSQLLKNHHEPINDLFLDLRDGNRLLSLLEVLTSKSYKRERGRMRVHHLNNVNRALQILEQNNVKLVNISSNDIVDGNPKLTLGLVWSVILHWQVHYHLKDLMTELQQTNLEKTLLAWCRQNSQNYPGVDIKNFTTSWSDGLAFNALLHRWKPQLFDFGSIARKHPNARLDHAFRLAQEHLGIERLLDPEDVNTSVPDKKSIMMYVMCLFQSLPHSGEDVGDLDISVASDSSPVTSPSAESGLSFANFGMPSSRPMSLATNVSVELGGYQVALEEVLTWLLEAEDKLSHAPSPGDNLDLLKEQFHEHESFLVELSKHQDGVGAVLEEGARLLADGGLQKDEEHEVRVQMSLLNSRWEDLRMRAMERQTKIHEVLMNKQQCQLDDLRQWLTKTEDKISRMAAVELSQSDLEEQMKLLNELEEDIRGQQGVVDGLRNIVVVVDEENSETVYAQMEDQLSALGERWSHICQWKEERGQRFRYLQSLWKNLMDDYKKLVAALNETEITLKQMEANPASELGEVLERIRKLQATKAQMDVNQEKLASLQNSIQELDDQSSSSEYADFLEKLEHLQDRWEAVGQMMEVQSQRISSSGFEVDLRSRTETVSGNEWMTESVTSIAYKEELVASSSPHSDPKKRRIGNTIMRDEFENVLLNLYKWLDYVDLEIGRSEGVFDELTVEEKKVVYDDTMADIESRKKDYEKVIEVGNRLIQELKSANESTEDEETKITDIQNCWQTTNNRLREIKQRIDFLLQIKQCRNEFANFNLLIDGYTKWFDGNLENDQIEPFRVKMKSMNSHEERLKKLGGKVQELLNVESSGDDIKALKSEMEVIVQNWETLSNRLSSRLKELCDAMDKTPPKKYIETMSSLFALINNVESVLLSEHAVMSDEETMEIQVKRFKELQDLFKKHQPDFDYVNATGHELIAKIGGESQGQRLTEELRDLNTKWSDIPIILDERQQKLWKDIEALKSFNKELARLNTWLDDSIKRLEKISSDDTLVNDVETAALKLGEIHSFCNEVEKTKPRIESLQTRANKLLENSAPKFANVLNDKLECISQKWHGIVDGMKTEGDKYESALRKNDEIINGIEDFTKWLSSLENDIPLEIRITSSVELFQVRGKYQILKEKIDKRVEEFRNLNEMGSEKLLSSEGSSVQDLGRRFTFLNARWTDVTDRIYERYRQLQNASHEYGEFRALVAQESDWLDKLEKRLKKSTKSAADAEEISEELDDLENYIRNHPDSRFKKIQEIGKQLLDSNIMTQSIQTDVEALTKRWEDLYKQAGERAKLLEGSVKQAQQSEGRILALQHSLTQVDSVLTARLDSDLTADDLPHDYQKLMEEMEHQEATLRDMANQIESYKASGKQEAAYRLQEQMALIEQKFTQVQRKFQRFRCPTNLEPRLSRALRELRGIEEATCLLELASEDPEAIEGQLKHCLRFYQTLSEIKSEIESIIVTGRKLVDDKSIPEPEKFSDRIDTLKELYNKLGLHITESKSILESALELSRDMYKNMTYITMSIESINKELDTQKNMPGLPVNAIYVTETLTEVVPRLNVVRDKLFRSQDEFSKLCDPMYLEQFRDKLSDVITRLAGTERRLRLCNGSEEEPNVDEIKAWLAEMEEKLNTLDTIPMDQLNERHFEQCQAIQSEMLETKARVTQLQRYTFYPKVAEVYDKWEKISKRIQEWIHKITDNLIIKSKPGDSKGRDNGNDIREKGMKKDRNVKLIDEEQIYGIGYLNPTFEDSQNVQTPKSTPINIPMRSRKSASAKSDTSRVVEISRTVRRRLDMSSVPDVVQTSQPQVVPNVDEDSDAEGKLEDEEFFLSKNSKLFSQVSANTLTAKDEPPISETNPCHIVEVKEMEIVKCRSMHSSKDHVVLPKANVRVEHVPQVVERVEIIEDTETEPESVDTDSEDKDNGEMRTELISRLREAKGERKREQLSLRLESPSVSLQITDNVNTTEKTTWKDAESVAEYLILDDSKSHFAENAPKSTGARRKCGGSKGSDAKEVTFKREVKVSKTYEIIGNISTSNEKQKSKRNRQYSMEDTTLEDCESFYGSDKETDDVLIFSDDTEIDVCSSSSEGEDISLGEHVENLLDKIKVDKISESKKGSKDFPDNRRVAPTTSSRSYLEREIIEFEQAAKHMLRRMDVMLMTIGSVSHEKDPTKRLEVLKAEISCLAPDAATLISKGDGLIMTVHTSDPVRAEKMKNEHQDKLRSKWHQVMSETEGKRIQAQRGEEALKRYNRLVTEFEEWFRDAPLKLEQANNYEGQLESFTEEFDAKQEDIHKLNEISTELKKLNVGYSENLRNSINNRWQEISSQFKRFSGSKEKEKLVTDKKMELDVDSRIHEFLQRCSKMKDAISTITKSLNSTPLNGKEYELFPSQEDCLKKIANALNILKPSVEEINFLCETVSRNARKDQTEQMRRLVDKLREDWITVNRTFGERQTRWSKCFEKWKDVQKNCRTFAEWLDRSEDKLKELSSASTKLSKTKSFELEQDIARMQRTMNNLVTTATEILNRALPEDLIEFRNTLETIKLRWQKLNSEIHIRKERNLAMEKKINNDDRVLEAAYVILEQINSLLISTANPSDETSLSIRLSLIKAREEELALRRRSIENAESQRSARAKDELSKTMSDMEKAATNLSSHREYVENKLTSLRKYIGSLDTVMTWVMETRTRLNISHELPQNESVKVIDGIMANIEDREMEVKDVLENYTNLEKECESAKQPVSVELQEKLKKLREDWFLVKNRGDPSDPEIEISTSMASSTPISRQKEVERSVGGASGAGAIAGGPQGLGPSLAPSTPSIPAVTSSSTSSTSTSSSPTSPTSPQPLTIVAGLDKSVLQIRDWLTLEEEMLRQQAVVVGDIDEILQHIDKQKNVLRELEQKKPQLDELVHTAENLRADTNRQQLHGKVTKLREHWDEANSKVMQRKTQLDAMLGDSQRYESKRTEVEDWLIRMENRLGRMRTVGHTADVLEAQLREQKSFHAELHQYKHQIELFNQLTQKLIAVYQQDDTTRVKKMTETINQRYNNLNTSIINRGKLLHSAMNSLHNFDRSLDKFLAWLSEAESSMEGLEAEADRLGGRRDQGALRRPQHQLKVRNSDD